MGLRGTGQGGFISRMVEGVQVLTDAGVLAPSYLLNLKKSTDRLGMTAGAGFYAGALRDPEHLALVDDRGPMTAGEIDRKSNAIARGLLAAGVQPGHAVGLFARNHRGFVLAQAALDKVGANTLLLNTGFAARQLREVASREGVGVILYDDEFRAIVEEGTSELKRIVTWSDSPGSEPTLDELAEQHDGAPLDAPAQHGRMTILTSGTTGTPKGARRSANKQGLGDMIGFFGRVPFRVGQRAFIPAPTFHAWGGMNLVLGASLGWTIYLRRKFDPEAALATLAEFQAESMTVVPVMMQRILELSPEVIGRYDVSSLRLVVSSGSLLPGELALRWMDTFGDNLHNLYGSTEVSMASIATPDELRLSPSTAGRPPRGVVVKILDQAGHEASQGETGRVFVGSGTQFEGYTGGGGKEMIDGLMSSGDVGHFDDRGLLYIDGRDDDMIISGGENVFPREVEDLLSDREDIVEAAVIGVPDDEFGQRLKGFVVRKPGATVDEAELKDYVKGNLARYKVPRDIVFLDALPRNPTGKVLKRELQLL